MKNNNDIQPLTPPQLEALCKVLADTNEGLTGSEIGHLLLQIGVKDTDPELTKWKRLYNALANYQNSQKLGNKVFSFINSALAPARYQRNVRQFEERRRNINVPLSFLGYEFGEDGRFYRRKKTNTITEAESRADRLRSALQLRNVHPDIMKFCRSEFLEDNCFHAVFEACKSIASKIRNLTGLSLDGSELISKAFSGDKPLIRINSLCTKTEIGEQKGFMNLAIGIFGTFRNPIAHEARIEWPISEEDALDLFCLASYIHRRIDNSICNR